jgi:imidazole glycerol-phosphate synthase subunit HisH
VTEANGRSAPRIAVLDYGMGNLRSVEKALARVGADVRITADHAEARAADGLILPGVGAFPAAMARIRERGLDVLLDDSEVREKPILGICLGMQLIFSSSTELGGAAGLGLVDGEVSELRAEGLKVPHIGWSPVRWERPSRLADGIASETPFYFVHSFAPRPAGDTVLGTAAYGERFACAIEEGNVFGVQFHPEKSSDAGLRALSNFVRICSEVRAPEGTTPTRA